MPSNYKKNQKKICFVKISFARERRVGDGERVSDVLFAHLWYVAECFCYCFCFSYNCNQKNARITVVFNRLKVESHKKSIFMFVFEKKNEIKWNWENWNCRQQWHEKKNYRFFWKTIKNSYKIVITVGQHLKSLKLQPYDCRQRQVFFLFHFYFVEFFSSFILAISLNWVLSACVRCLFFCTYHM